MIKRKQLFSVVIILALIMTILLAGCGNDNASTDSSVASAIAANSSAAASSEVKPLEPVKMKWYYFQNQFEEQDLVFAEVNKLLKEKINAEIEFLPQVGSTYNTKMSTVIASQEEFDLCFTASWRNDYVGNASK